MKSTLYLKFIFVYLIFGFLSVFSSLLLSSHLVSDPITETQAADLYKSASLISSDFLPQYYDGGLHKEDVKKQLSGAAQALDASIWLVNKSGNVIACSASKSYELPSKQIENFNPNEAGNNAYLKGSYHDFFSEEVLTVITPVIYDYEPQSYLLIHKSTSDIDSYLSIFQKTLYTILILVFVLSLSILLAFHIFVYRPLYEITDAARKYASGHLDYVIPVKSQDEMGYLSASLNYMASQLSDMESYQKSFVANVSHDFRSPLTSIKGYVTAMADGTIPPELYEKYLNIILFETDRLTDLTQDLLTLNEFDTKHLLLKKSKFDMHEVIKAVASSFEGSCTQKKIHIELLFAAKECPVYADKAKIQQVLYNLLDNAIKFSDYQSSITIETTERGDKLYTSVKDDGMGIPKKDLNKIWERFYKSDLSRGKDKKGTGLGLSIVKEVISAHEENINVISTEGVGTEFIFSLPKA